MDVREEKTKRLARITNANGLQISSMLPVHKEEAMASWMIADPQYWNAGSPHWHPTIQHQCMPERRRIVAQVRRKVPKNRDFFAVQKFFRMMRRFVDIGR
jgi:hypothetical protein